MCKRAVLTPKRAEAAAASQPAWPPPITTTSKNKSFFHDMNLYSIAIFTSFEFIISVNQ